MLTENMMAECLQRNFPTVRVQKIVAQFEMPMYNFFFSGSGCANVVGSVVYNAYKNVPQHKRIINSVLNLEV